MCFISMYSVLKTLSEFTYFYISKKLFHTPLQLVSKIVESLQCVLNRFFDLMCHWRIYVSLDVMCKKIALQNFTKLSEEHLGRSFYSIKLCKCFLVTFAKYFRTDLSRNPCKGLILLQTLFFVHSCIIISAAYEIENLRKTWFYGISVISLHYFILVWYDFGLFHDFKYELQNTIVYYCVKCRNFI